MNLTIVDEILTIIEDHGLTYEEATKYLVTTLSKLENLQRRQAAKLVIKFCADETC
jgi:hypothetical protein